MAKSENMSEEDVRYDQKIPFFHWEREHRDYYINRAIKFAKRYNKGKFANYEVVDEILAMHPARRYRFCEVMDKHLSDENAKKRFAKDCLYFNRYYNPKYEVHSKFEELLSIEEINEFHKPSGETNRIKLYGEQL